VEKQDILNETKTWEAEIEKYDSSINNLKFHLDKLWNFVIYNDTYEFKIAE
jgi:hypothetical protein